MAPIKTMPLRIIKDGETIKGVLIPAKCLDTYENFLKVFCKLADTEQPPTKTVLEVGDFDYLREGFVTYQHLHHSYWPEFSSFAEGESALFVFLDDSTRPRPKPAGNDE